MHTKPKYCTDCKRGEPDVEFTKSRMYTCKGCIKLRNQKYSVKIGCTLKFIPIVTDTHKQCCECKELKELNEYSRAIRGRKGKAAYCKPCASLYQMSRKTKEERRIATQKYRDNNREWWRYLHRITQFNRKNRVKLASDGTVTSKFIKEVLCLTHCYYCKQYVETNLRTIEHIYPLNRGGKNTSTNITMACLSCNTSKGAKTEE